MISFTVSIFALIIGYLLYGRFVERVFKPDNRPTPAIAKADGVDYWTMPAFNFADESGYVSLADLLDAESVAYGINIIDHAAEPMQQSIIVVRQLLQYVQGLVSAFQQQGQAQQGQSQQQGVVTQ